ncbi:MAG TPA: hypothetical protein VNN80_29720, partial [Polyangiaceae bacterium]|nr:hypothetical protein [Polyangiaceae bacterium]
MSEARPRSLRNLSLLAVCAVLFAVFLPVRVTFAQEGASLTGKWQAEPMTVRWVIGSWGDACGPRPTGGGDSGGVVSIEERGGELVIAGEGGGFSTDQCWQMGTGVTPQSHAAAGGSWKTTCRTPPGDQRQEVLQMSLGLSGGVLSLHESGQYQFVAKGQTCAASSGRWRTYRRLPAEPPPRPQGPCATPGAAERLEVRPSRKLMRAGESFHFRASVFDAHGCSLGTPVTWSVEPEQAARIEAGRLTLAADARDTQLQVTATAAGQSVRVQVDVVSDDRYAALLASGKFNADGASDGVVVGGSLGAGDATESAGRSDRKWTFVGLVSSIALGFALIGAWLLRRARRTAAKAARAPRRSRASVAFATDDTVAEARRRPLEATRLEQHVPPMSAAKPASVCPVCGTMYETPGARICPRDGAH